MFETYESVGFSRFVDDGDSATYSAQIRSGLICVDYAECEKVLGWIWKRCLKGGICFEGLVLF